MNNNKTLNGFTLQVNYTNKKTKIKQLFKDNEPPYYYNAIYSDKMQIQKIADIVVTNICEYSKKDTIKKYYDLTLKIGERTKNGITYSEYPIQL